MLPQCPYCESLTYDLSGFQTVVRTGSFLRTSDSKKIQRFRCLPCKKGFSKATLHPYYRQRKRHKNHKLMLLFSACVSQREMARVENLNRKTIARKLKILGPIAKNNLAIENTLEPLCSEIEFDDMETFEHTKFKPLSMTLAVEFKTRRVLGLEVSQMPAKGLLAKKSVQKYGIREDKRAEARRRLFETIKPLVIDQAIIRSDSNPHYPEDVKKHFPNALHQSVIGKRGAITGQGELKKTEYDPIFSLNHTAAMFRAHTSRLIRKTWNTTKDPERLIDHLAIYAFVHNRRLKKLFPALNLQ